MISITTQGQPSKVDEGLGAEPIMSQAVTVLITCLSCFVFC